MEYMAPNCANRLKWLLLNTWSSIPTTQWLIGASIVVKTFQDNRHKLLTLDLQYPPISFPPDDNGIGKQVQKHIGLTEGYEDF